MHPAEPLDLDAFFDLLEQAPPAVAPVTEQATPAEMAPVAEQVALVIEPAMPTQPATPATPAAPAMGSSLVDDPPARPSPHAALRAIADPAAPVPRLERPDATDPHPVPVATPPGAQPGMRTDELRALIESSDARIAALRTQLAVMQGTSVWALVPPRLRLALIAAALGCVALAWAAWR